jgi:arginine-tRNA-protein transferase
VPLRVPVDRFEPTRSMRRIMARNHDVSVTAGEPEPSPEKYEMFRRYLEDQHDSTMSRSLDTFLDFLYDSPAETFEFTYRCGPALVGVSIADRCSDGISSVYMFFDPAWKRRSPGTFSVLREIEHCRAEGGRYYYLGYYIEGCGSMEYKRRFRPNEILSGADEWIPFRE